MENLKIWSVFSVTHYQSHIPTLKISHSEKLSYVTQILKKISRTVKFCQTCDFCNPQGE